MLPLLLSLLITSVVGFYSSGDGVVTLTPSNFDSEVAQSDSVWIVEFYAPWYVYCNYFFNS